MSTNFFTSFLNHTKLACYRDACANSELVNEKSEVGFRQKIDKNILEKFGDVMVWPVREGIPKTIRFAKDIKTVTIALMLIALIGVTFAFYPTASWAFTKSAAIAILTHIPWVAIKATAYAFCMFTIVGMGTRTLGRFTNKNLLEHFYACNKVKAERMGHKSDWVYSVGKLLAAPNAVAETA